jgi:hypothetical protein
MSQENTDTQAEKRIESSLTAPDDRALDKSGLAKYQSSQGQRGLSETEVQDALDKLNDNTFVKKFLAVERRYADPVEPMQRIGLISFVPALGATPNDKGIYGFAKLRGNYATDTEASERAETLIRTTDSYHKIFHAYVGRPFPLTEKSTFSGDEVEVDIKKSMADSVSASIKSKKKDEQQEIREIEQREKQLKEESKRDEATNPLEHYTTLQVKRAQITWTFLETKKKLKDMRDIIFKTRKEIAEMDAEDDSYSKEYYAKYTDARKEAGLDNVTTHNNFMKFLVEDLSEEDRAEIESAQ